MEEIINKVSNSQLITLDLGDFSPKGERLFLDIKQWLTSGIVLKEKDFRLSLKTQDWSFYQDKHVALGCSTEAILPQWTYLLVSSYLQEPCSTVFLGSLAEMEAHLFYQSLQNLDVSPFLEKRIIIKGCTNKSIPENAYLHLFNRLFPVVKSLMYGEACSTVPLFKK